MSLISSADLLSPRFVFISFEKKRSGYRDTPEAVCKYHLPDFSNWKNHAAFEAAYARLENDLRTSIGK